MTEIGDIFWTENRDCQKQNQINYVIFKENISAVQKEVNIAGLRWKSLEWPSYKAGPGLVSGNLDFRRVPTIPRTEKSGWLTMSKLGKQRGLF